MSKNYPFHRSYLIVLSLAILATGSCATYYSTKDLKKGVTGQFDISMFDQETSDKYDWTKLKGDYGLFVFSYRLTAFGETDGKFDTIDYREGLRIFEHRFEPDQPDTFVKVLEFELLKELKEKIGHSEEYTLRIFMPCTFVKRQLIYGGVAEIDAKPGFSQCVAELWLDPIFTDFLNANKDQLESVVVDTIKLKSK